MSQQLNTTAHFFEDRIAFLEWGEDAAAFIARVERAMGLTSKNRKTLIWVIRTEFEIENEVVPLFVDEDGSAKLELQSISSSIRQLVAARIRESGEFENIDMR